MRPVLLLAAAACLSSGCEQPNARGARAEAGPPGDAPAREAGPDAGGGRQAEVDAQPDRVPESDAPADAPPPVDRAGDEGPPPPVDSAPEALPIECRTGETGCSLDRHEARLCNAAGRWTVTATCAAGSVCTAARCLCEPGPGDSSACDEGPIHHLLRPVQIMSAGRDALYLVVDYEQPSLRRFVPRDGREQTLQMSGEERVDFSIDADAMDNLVWCTLRAGPKGEVGQLLIGERVLESTPCRWLRKLGNDIYYAATDSNIYRRSLVGLAPQVVARDPGLWRFEVTGDHIYYLFNQDDAYLQRVSLSDPTRVTTLVTRQLAEFRALAVDGAHVYVVDEDRVLRVPLAGGVAETFWRGAGEAVRELAQTASHLYWSTETGGVRGCARSQVWRRAKEGGPPTALTTVMGQCAGPLALLGDRLYAATSSGYSHDVVPAQLLRLVP
jgi:hypothetical protein